MKNIENHNEILSKNMEIKSVVDKSKVALKKLKAEINENEDKIWWYKVINKFDWFLEPSEKWFAIVLAEGEAGPDDIDVSIIVKYENWKITIRDTQQEPFGEKEYNEITLFNNEQIKWNDDVNKINKLISSRWFNPITGDDLNKLAQRIEALKE